MQEKSAPRTPRGAVAEPFADRVSVAGNVAMAARNRRHARRALDEHPAPR
jgi:hypothetical protein